MSRAKAKPEQCLACGNVDLLTQCRVCEYYLCGECIPGGVGVPCANCEDSEDTEAEELD